MNRLRDFRHFVRHGYGAEIEVKQLNINLELAQQLQVLFPKDVEFFLTTLGVYPEPSAENLIKIVENLQYSCWGFSV